MKRKLSNESRSAFTMLAPLIALIVLFITFGYSAFQSSGIISDVTATVRPEMNIRITGLTTESTSNATVKSMDYNSTSTSYVYTGKVFSELTFTSTSSSAIYKVEVTNFGNTEMGVASITGLPNNLTYELDTNNYDIGEKICDNNNSSKCTLGAKKYIYVTIKYKSGSGTNTSTNLTANFDLNFKEIHKVYYGGDTIDYVIDGGNKVVNLGSNPPTYISVSGTLTSNSYTSPNVTLNGVTSDITIEEIHKIYLDNTEIDTVVHGGNKTISLGSNAPSSASDITITGTYGSSSYNNPNLTLNNVTTDIHITISSGGSGGGTWTEPVEDHTVNVYDPDNMTIPPSSTIKYEEVTGQPQISTDASGNITRFEYTDIDANTGISLPSGGLDTGILAFDGRDFTATLTATLTFSGCTKNICPVLGAATKTTSVNGALIYEMRVASSGYGHNASGANQNPPYNKFRFGRYENSNATGSDDFNINSKITSSTSSGRYGYNSSTSSVKLTFKLYYTSGVFSSEIYDASGNILAKPHNNLTITFSNTSGSAFNDITIEVGHFQHNTEYTHTFTIHDFKVVKS